MRPPIRSSNRSRRGLLPAVFILGAVASVGQTASMESTHFMESHDGEPSIPLLPPERMPAEDTRLAAGRQAAIASTAQIYGYALNSSYSYREIACPFAPRHLLLAYESDQSNGAISRFTVVLPREDDGSASGRSRVQLIPILRFGVQPFVAPASNPHSIAVFNEAVSPAPVGVAALADLQAGSEPVLLRGLCYLAMVGAEPDALYEPSVDEAAIHAPVPELQILAKGRMRQLISVRSSPAEYQLWAMTFSGAGKLLSAAREEHPVRPNIPALQAAAQTSPNRPPEAAETARPSDSLPDSTQNPLRTAPGASQAQPSTPSQPTETMVAPSTPSATTPPEAVPAPTVAMTKPVATSDAATAKGMPSSSVETPAGTVTAARPQMTAAAVATPPPAANSGLSASTPASLPARASLPEPPHRFIPEGPSPPRRVIPASALQSPPHLPQ